MMIKDTLLILSWQLQHCALSPQNLYSQQYFLWEGLQLMENKSESIISSIVSVIW